MCNNFKTTPIVRALHYGKESNKNLTITGNIMEIWFVRWHALLNKVNKVILIPNCQRWHALVSR